MSEIKIAVILDEIDSDFLKSVEIAKEVGIEHVELRVLNEKNIVQIGIDDARRYERIMENNGLKACAMASPLMKCFLPGEKDEKVVGDQFGFTMNDYSEHLDMIDHTVELAKIFKVDLIRSFTFWKVEETTDEKLKEIAEKLKPLIRKIEYENMKLMIENEPNCYVQTGRQLGKLLDLLSSPNVGALWDPGNAKMVGECEKDGFEALKDRIFHVHIKDFKIENGTVKFVLPGMGNGMVDFDDVISALLNCGYNGFISFEFIMNGVRKDDLKIVYEKFREMIS